MSEPNVRVKIWVDDDSFEAGFAIPVTATPQQIESFTQLWFGVLQQALKLWPTERQQASSEKQAPATKEVVK